MADQAVEQRGGQRLQEPQREDAPVAFGQLVEDGGGALRGVGHRVILPDRLDLVVVGGYDSVLDRGLRARALRRLPPEHRLVLLEIYYRDVPAERAATVPSIPAGTVRSRHHYALRALRVALADA